MEKKKQIGEHIVDHLSERMNEEIVDPVLDIDRIGVIDHDAQMVKQAVAAVIKRNILGDDILTGIPVFERRIVIIAEQTEPVVQPEIDRLPVPNLLFHLLRHQRVVHNIDSQYLVRPDAENLAIFRIDTSQTAFRIVQFNPDRNVPEQVIEHSFVLLGFFIGFYGFRLVFQQGNHLVGTG